MTITCWNDLEDDQMQGIPLAAQVFYLRGLRRHMDYENGLVGVKRRTSWQALSEVVYVEPHQGAGATGALGKQQIRRLATVLERAGLVEIRSDTKSKRLVFFLPLAFTDQSVQKNTDTKPTHPEMPDTDIDTGTHKSNNGGPSAEKADRDSDTKPTHPEMPDTDRHPISDIKDKKPYTEADASVSAPPVISQSRIPSPAGPQRQAPLLPPVALSNTAPPREPKVKAAKPRVSTAPVWASYSAAYQARYGVAPVRNSTINGQLAHLVRRLGDEAPAVARYYLDLEDPYYRRVGHSVGALLKHCEQLRTLWKRAEQRRASPSAALNPDDVVIAL